MGGELLVTSEQHHHPTTVSPAHRLRGCALARPGSVTCLTDPPAGRLAPSRVSDRRTRPLLPSASWVRKARSASAPLGRFTARAGLVLFALVAAVGTADFAVPASAQTTGKSAIALVSQDPWVQTSSIPIRLGLRLHSSVPGSDLSVAVALYTEPDGSALASRDEFEATLAGQFAGLSELPQATFAASSLQGGKGSVELYVGGSGLPGRIPKRAPPGQVFQLPCPQRSG